MSDANGFYKIADLPTGDYNVSFFYADVTIEQDAVQVGVNRSAVVNQAIDVTQAGETIKVQAKAPNIVPLAAHRE